MHVLNLHSRTSHCPPSPSSSPPLLFLRCRRACGQMEDRWRRMRLRYHFAPVNHLVVLAAEYSSLSDTCTLAAFGPRIKMPLYTACVGMLLPPATRTLISRAHAGAVMRSNVWTAKLKIPAPQGAFLPDPRRRVDLIRILFELRDIKNERPSSFRFRSGYRKGGACHRAKSSPVIVRIVDSCKVIEEPRLSLVFECKWPRPRVFIFPLIFSHY